MLIIFDWDGTLIDSTGKIVSSMQKAVKQLGLPDIEDVAIQNIIGLGLPEAIRTLYPKEPGKVRLALQKGYSAAYVEADAISCPLYDGVEDTLDRLKNAGHQVAVATGKSRRGLNRVLKNLAWEGYFDATRCADETASKPSPKMLEELLSEFELKPQDAIMVGDTEYDLLMAKHAAMPSIGVSHGAHAIDHLVKFDPLMVVDHISEVGNYVVGKCSPVTDI